MSILLVGAGLAFFRAHPAQFPMPFVSPHLHRPVVAVRMSASDIASIIVTVTGEVDRPGTLTLLEGTTLKGLFEAVRPKATACLDHAEYGRPLRDGDEVHIPARLSGTAGKVWLTDETLQRVRIRSTAAPRSPLSEKSAGTRVNINRATVEELQNLPRIGPETARRIIAERNAHGTFKQKQDILRVRGIGRKTYQWLEPLITVE